MSLRVDSSSSKIVLGVAAVTALAVGTALYLRSRRSDPAAASLDNGRFTFLANVPLLGRVYTHFNPTKPAPAELPNITLGTEAQPIRTIEELRIMLSEVQQGHQSLGALIIYGKNLVIDQDPGILALKPMKLILVGASIIPDEARDSSDNFMHINGWGVNQARDMNRGAYGMVIEVASVEDALNTTARINPVTRAPLRMVYSVKA